MNSIVVVKHWKMYL